MLDPGRVNRAATAPSEEAQMRESLYVRILNRSLVTRCVTRSLARAFPGRVRDRLDDALNRELELYASKNEAARVASSKG